MRFPETFRKQRIQLCSRGIRAAHGAFAIKLKAKHFCGEDVLCSHACVCCARFFLAACLSRAAFGFLSYSKVWIFRSISCLEGRSEDRDRPCTRKKARCLRIVSPQIIRPIFKLRISKIGVWVKQILKRRRWIFLAHRLIS